MGTQSIIRSIVLGSATVCSWAGIHVAAQDLDWDTKQFDPAAVADESTVARRADIWLPMPCGGAMAFQRVDVIHRTNHDESVGGSSLLVDKPIRLGSDDTSRGHVEYWRHMHLRGSFVGDDDPDISYYFIGRYEVTVQQKRALQGDCSVGDDDRKPAVELSWFDAVMLARSYSEWLRKNNRDQLPRAGGKLAFVRLPTEAEWEYAVRGGSKVIDRDKFYAVRFFDENEMSIDDVAWHAGNASGNSVHSVGSTKLANPLGLYDVYGNAAEIVLEPFQINVAGRLHGQIGGTTVRGGSFRLREVHLHSARRTERPVYNQRGDANTYPDDGVRFVIAAEVFDDRSFLEIKQGWRESLRGGGTGSQGALSKLGELIDQAPDSGEILEKLEELIDQENNPSHGIALERVRELVQAHTAEIEEVRALVLREQDVATSARRETLKSMFVHGAALVSMIRVFSVDLETMNVRFLSIIDLMELERSEVETLRHELLELKKKNSTDLVEREKLSRRITEKEEEIGIVEAGLRLSESGLDERRDIIARDQRLRANALRAYGRLMHSFIHSYGSHAIESAYWELRAELQAAENEEDRLSLVDDVFEDVQEYDRERMTTEELLERITESQRR